MTADAARFRRGGGPAGGYEGAATSANRLLDIALALFFLLLASPLFLVIPALIILLDRNRPLYKGDRLGFHKKPFAMYKFRTLVPHAQGLIGANVLTERLSADIEVLSPLGRFLRESRLDELPQLLNILKGDMDFMGPRPERLEVYEKICSHIQGYDARFSVRPGLLGYAQLFTPHSTPKAIRTRIDNLFVSRKGSIPWKIFVVAYTGAAVLRRSLRFGLQYFYHDLLLVRILGLLEEKRSMSRTRLSESKGIITVRDPTGSEAVYETDLVDMNEDAILMHGPPFDMTEVHVRLTTPFNYRRLHWKKVRRTRVADVTGEVMKKALLPGHSGRYAYVVKYTPISPYNYYVIHQYFLAKSVA